MSAPTVALAVGTRPEAIKLAPLVFALKARGRLHPFLISTGQHREMLDQTFAVFGLRPDADLALMQRNQTLPELTARVIGAMTEWLADSKPAAVLVQGDTTTAFSSALAAFYARIPVGHVEAGLRTYNFEAPWPEEMNRRLVDPISKWCFAPTELARSNLLAERIPETSVHVTGNTVIDSLLWVRAKQSGGQQSDRDRARKGEVKDGMADQFFGRHGPNRRWILVTGHRRESFGEGFESICQSILAIVDSRPDVGVIYPVHLNPKVQEPVRRLLGHHERISLVNPLGYEDFVWFMDRSHFILSDSGGVQEEAPSLGKPVLVMRETTERPEGVRAGTSRVVGTDKATILREAFRLLDDPAEYAARSSLRNPYGDGKSADRIAAILERDLCG